MNISLYDLTTYTDGLACGDSIRLELSVENSAVYFKFSGYFCDTAKKVSDYLESNCNGLNLEKLSVKLNKLSEEVLSNKDNLKHRSCAFAPISSLREALDKFMTDDMFQPGETANPLACDACVRVLPINWNVLPVKPLTKSPTRIHKRDNDDSEATLLRLGKCVLSENEQAEFAELLKNTKDINRIKKLRLVVPYFNNAFKYGIGLPGKLKSLAVKQIISMTATRLEITKIDEFITENGLSITAVKGTHTANLYPTGTFRTHMDYDYLASKQYDAFIMIDQLINVLGYKFISNGSVPYSYKVIKDDSGREVLTAHIHLEKIVQNRFQVIVDINFGGFPLGRTSIINIKKGNTVSLEEQVCITLSHVFKHGTVYVKDINDLFYLLNSRLDFSRLSELISKNDLDFLFAVVLVHLRKAYGYDVPVKIKNYLPLCHLLLNWPYSAKAQYSVQRLDNFFRCVKQFGLFRGFAEMNAQIRDCGQIASDAYATICPVLNTRVYLNPLVLFTSLNSLSELKSNPEYSQIKDSELYRYNDLLVTPNGVFLINSERQFSKSRIESDVNVILRQINAKPFTEYLMEARKDLWLY
ncbi:hypothetical protein FACS1894187_18190 [Synergistales bacterium]|nr:hypothetical protein FACS1894187_18190 [Synergistales bacterium]